TGDTWKTWVEGYALVPMVPLDVRPKVGVLEGWHILWEVERWADDEIRVQPDIDPYLLKHVTGSFYAVIAEWNLTRLQRSIMRSRDLDRRSRRSLPAEVGGHKACPLRKAGGGCQGRKSGKPYAAHSVPDAPND